MGERAETHDRRTHRRAQSLGKRDKLFGGVCGDTAAACHYVGAFRAVYHFYGTIDSVFISFRFCRFFGYDGFVVADCLLNVFRHVDEHRSAPAAHGYLERLAHCGGELTDVLYDIVVLGYRHRYAGYIDLLEAVSAEQRHGDVAGYGNHGYAVHIGVGNAGDEVGRARPRCSYDYAHLSRSPRVPVGGVRRALFVRGQHLLYLVSCRVKRVERIDNLSAGVAENGVYALFLETLDDYLTSFEFTFHITSPFIFHVFNYLLNHIYTLFVKQIAVRQSHFCTLFS